MKKLIGTFGILGILSAMSGCAYGGVAVAGDKAIVLRNDGLLFGALRKAFVCKIADDGLHDCVASAEKP